MKKKILVAPLNWGLGHATRCIPIVNALIENHFEPILASDGDALDLLKKEFPELTCIELPGYDIKYPKRGVFLKLKLLTELPKIITAVRAERKMTKQIVETYLIDGIISDNRLGVRHNGVPSVFMTHQLQVLSGSTTWLTTRLHQKIFSRFDACWVPDTFGPHNLSGKLGHATPANIKVKHIGPLSRFEKMDCKIRHDVMVLLSGPEPQRGLLEKRLITEFKNYDGNVLFVKGIVEEEQTYERKGNMTIWNYLMGSDLQRALNESELIVSRSGYTTIMDLAKLQKNAYFIPTPGQYEQTYLAKRLSDKGLVPSCKQSEFKLEKLKDVENYKGFKHFDFAGTVINFKTLFQLFEGE